MIRVKGCRPNPPLTGWTGFVAVDFCLRGMLAEPAVRDAAMRVAAAMERQTGDQSNRRTIKRALRLVQPSCPKTMFALGCDSILAQEATGRV